MIRSIFFVDRMYCWVFHTYEALYVHSVAANHSRSLMCGTLGRTFFVDSHNHLMYLKIIIQKFRSTLWSLQFAEFLIETLFTTHKPVQSVPVNSSFDKDPKFWHLVQSLYSHLVLEWNLNCLDCSHDRSIYCMIQLERMDLYSVSLVVDVLQHFYSQGSRNS